jgi:hypothetical protein
MPNPNDVGQALTTTLNSYKPEIISNIIDNHPLLNRLQAKGNIVKASGGVNFQEKISYAQNGTVQSQGEYDTFNTTPQDVLATATFAQKIITGTMTMTDLEMKQNSGKEAFINLAEAKKKVLIESLKNYLGSQIYADGTGSGGKEIGGLQLLIADAPTTGTVGAINRANYSVWQNKLYDFSVESVTASSSTIQSAFNTLWTRCQAQAGELPDLIAADSVYFSFFESSLQTVQRITDPSIGALGFSSYKYKNADVFYDPECPASHAYFINTNHVFLKYLGKDLLEVGETMRPVNQNAYVTPIVFTGNMTIDNARVHGVMHA